jgi:hypothetical protein
VVLTIRRNATTGARRRRVRRRSMTGARADGRQAPHYDSGFRHSSRGESQVVARFHGGFLDGQLVADWATPPATSVWIERVAAGVVAIEPPPAAPPESGEEGPGYDHYVLSEVVADLAVYHAADG